MPPRYAYWTILVDGQPTAFRSGALDDLMPTFNRLKEKQPTAELKWFQNGELWASRHDAQDAMRARGDRGRERDLRQGGGPGGRGPGTGKPEWKPKSDTGRRDPGSGGRNSKKLEWKPDPAPRTPHPGKPEWKPASVKATAWQGLKGAPGGRPVKGRQDEKPEWRPKGTFKPKEAGHASGWGEKQAFAKAADGNPGWKPRGDKPSWKSKSGGSARDQARSSFRPKPYTPKPGAGKPAWTPKSGTGRQDPGSGVRDLGAGKREWKTKPVKERRDPESGIRNAEKLEWKPKGGTRTPDPGPRLDGAPKRKWVPKAEYKKSLGIEAKRDDKWRPGGEHKDPKQKYKDAKKAKWTRVKATIRARSTKRRADK